MFNPLNDYAPARETLRLRGRVQVHDVLEPRYAEQFRQYLADEKTWDLSYRDGDTSTLLASAEYATRDRTQLLAELARLARSRYAYAFDSYLMLQRYASEPEHPLHHLVDVFHHEGVLDFVRKLTGDASIRRVKIQATRYLPGHFLRRHDDTSVDDDNRRFAFVFNLSRRWQADWGGLLHFLDERERVLDTFVPVFNSLSLFKVPQQHFVSLVAPWAEEPRYSLTGWFVS